MTASHAAGLRSFAEDDEHEIIHLATRFNPNAPDIEWISTLGQEGDWIIISGDMRISRNPAERQAWLESGLTAFFFGDAWSRSRYWKKAADLVAWWPDITRYAREHPNGHGYTIPKEGKVLRQVYPIRE